MSTDNLLKALMLTRPVKVNQETYKEIQRDISEIPQSVVIRYDCCLLAMLQNDMLDTDLQLILILLFDSLEKGEGRSPFNNWSLFCPMENN